MQKTTKLTENKYSDGNSYSLKGSKWWAATLVNALRIRDIAVHCIYCTEDP